ncbi:hypothetical protein HCH_00245 [Hahella chejuensis KCTC 2396]|uniref:Uncharacterized protein n=2 Tax=Hahella chejuensis TaxID=158327 RepID=Q2SQB4_HAHCH|nr:hypothetical protein HCH_00245 [Hahella chejuensis KCTC 2396]
MSPSMEWPVASRPVSSTITIQIRTQQAPDTSVPEADIAETPVPDSTPATSEAKPEPPQPTQVKPEQRVVETPPKPRKQEEPAALEKAPPAATVKLQTEPASQPRKKLLLDNALEYARDNVRTEPEDKPKHFDRRLDQALMDAKIYNQEGEYPPDAVESFEDSAGRRFVKVQGGGCFELVSEEMSRRKGDVWYFSDGCGGSDDDKIQIDFKNLN